MSLNSIIRVGVPTVFTSLLLSQQFAPSTIMNESKRQFYEDEENVTPIPGTIITASDAEVKSLGPNKLINGSSIRSPSIIQSYFSKFRLQLDSLISSTENKIDSVTTNFHNKEQHFSSTIANLHNKDEDLFSAGIYILVAGLSGTILTRRSNVLFKGLVPLIFGIAAFKVTLPKTFKNTTHFAHEIEHQQVPALAQKQDDLIKHTGLIINKTEIKTKEVENKVESRLQKWKTSFKKFTGLRIDEDATKK